MKRTFYLLTGLAMLMSSCQKENEFEVNSSDNQVQLTSGIATRASGTDWAQSDKVGIYMLNGSDKTVLSSNIEHTNTATSGATATWAVINADETLYYPQRGTVNFLAYYPHQANITDYIYKVDVTDQRDLTKIDLMSASKTGVSRSKTAVDLTFSHKLSNIKLTIKAGDGLTAKDIEDIVVLISGTSLKADYNLLMDEIVEGASSVITIPQMADGSNNRKAEAIVIPKSDVSWVRFVFDVSGVGYFVSSLPSGTMKFESGKQYMYTITISRTAATITASTIIDWIPGNGNGEGGTAELFQPKIGDYYYSDNTYSNYLLQH